MTNLRDFVNIMDYIGSDYHNAVREGEIADKTEYDEMQEFSKRAGSLYYTFGADLPDSVRTIIELGLAGLNEAINAMQPGEKVGEITNSIKLAILKLNLIEIVPKSMPDLKNGKIVFEQNCAKCHGVSGDGSGPQGASLDPKPANFHNVDLMSRISNFQIFNTVKLGIKGTGMAPITTLSDKDTWDAAFYVNSIRYRGKYGSSIDTIAKLYENLNSRVSLNDLSSLSDKQLNEKYPENTGNYFFLAALRLHDNNSDKNASFETALNYLKMIDNSCKIRDYESAEDLALKAYLEGIEPYEGQLEAINPGLKSNVESAMYRLRADIRLKKSMGEIETDITTAHTLILQAQSEMGQQEATFWFAFLMAASIILREGLEAILIIITILGVLNSINAPRAKRWVHAGWVTALVLGFVSMFYIDMIVRIGVRNREMVEGIGSFIAVGLLIYIGFWLHSKTEAKKWKEFVEGKIMKMVSGKNMMGLAVISFVVVFREAFESAIFLSAVNFESQAHGNAGMYTGALVSLAVVLLFAWLIVRFSVRLPIRKLFKYSALIIAALSVVLMGKGIRALQESGYMNVTEIPLHLNVSLLGIYPTMETFIAQILLLGITIFIWNFAGKRARGTG